MEDKVNTFTNTEGMALSRERDSINAIKEKRAAIEAGMEEMERGLERLGLRIELCRDRMATKTQANPRTLSLKEKLESTRRISFDTRKIERETRNNCRKLNEIAAELKGELAKRRAMGRKRPRPALKPVARTKAASARPSAKILRFSPIKTDE